MKEQLVQASDEPWMWVAYTLSLVGLICMLTLVTRLHLRRPRDPLTTLAWAVLLFGVCSVLIRTSVFVS